MSALLKKRAKERAAAQERRLRGEDVSGDEGGEEVDELAMYKVRACVCVRSSVCLYLGPQRV